MIMKIPDKDIFNAVIQVFGEKEQENMVIEECSELIIAIRHKQRGRPHNIAEEIADVEIMLEQLKIINHCSDEVNKIRGKKISRLFDRILNKL